MKKGLSILVYSIAILGLTLSLSGVLVSQAAPAEKQQGSNREAPKPIPATNIEVVKKVFSEDVGKGKGKPSPAPKTGSVATGVLGAPTTGNKYAVIIGICDYPGTNLDLCQSDGDSLHMYKTLTELYGYKPENIMLFKDGGGTTGFVVDSATGEKKTAGVPTRNNIYQAVMDIKNNPNLTQDDEVVFFFSGHGTKGSALDGKVAGTDDGESIDEAIVVWNTEANTENNITYIWDGELRNWFDGFATARIAFVFDSCLAGGMNDVASVGRVVSMATGETQSAYVYSTAGEDVDGNGVKDGEGVFTRYFVNEGMLQGLADVHDYVEVEGNEPATVEEAFDYTKAKANASSYLKVRQKPVISDNLFNDLLL